MKSRELQSWETCLAHVLRLLLEIIVTQLSFSSALIFIKPEEWDGSSRFMGYNNHFGSSEGKGVLWQSPKENRTIAE